MSASESLYQGGQPLPRPVPAVHGRRPYRIDVVVPRIASAHPEGDQILVAFKMKAVLTRLGPLWHIREIKT